MSDKDKNKTESTKKTETFGRTTPTPSNALKPKVNITKTKK
jgi:hypothetical protein